MEKMHPNMFGHKTRTRVGVAGCQSSGKTSVINALIEYPLLPVCQLRTTCVPVELRYGEKIHIEVKTASGEKIDVPCYDIDSPLFWLLADYFVNCKECIGLENVRYFVSSIFCEGKKTILSDLCLNPSDPKHIAVLILTVLCAYVHQNNPNCKDPEVLLMQERQKHILYRLGLDGKGKNYFVSVCWDSLFLKNNLSLIDLPGFGADVDEANGFLSHSQTALLAAKNLDKLVYVLVPQILIEGEELLAEFKNIKGGQFDVIPVINKIDDISAGVSSETVLNSAKTFFKRRAVDCDEIHCISALFSEQVFIENGLIEIWHTNFASKRLQTDFDGDIKGLQEDLPGIQRLLQKRYEQSGIKKFRGALISFADAGHSKEGRKSNDSASATKANYFYGTKAELIYELMNIFDEVVHNYSEATIRLSGTGHKEAKNNGKMEVKNGNSKSHIRKKRVQYRNRFMS